jgi:methylenetetrahydrofolate dehydrogenase (NADP+) / methenyltetrahydrofolate cyclohydrolase
MKDKIIDGKELSALLKNSIKDEILKLQNKFKRPPCLVVILVGNDPASTVYVNLKSKNCEELGMESKVYRLKEETKESELLNLIDELNSAKEVDGILVQLPLPKHINTANVIHKIDPLKDVDCFHPENFGLLFSGNPRFLPCTPAGIIELLKYKKINLSGKNAVVLGRSNIVGKPVSILLLSENATVTICHSKTENLKDITKKCDILVAAIGKSNFVKSDMVKDGAVIIDVGMNKVGDKLVGDVDYDDVINKVSYITPVPGGVGPMTRIMLMKNTVKAYQLRNN